MQQSYTISGQAIIGRDFTVIPATITVENGVITALEEESRAPDQWIVPRFFNAHTHLADTVAMDTPIDGSLSELVAPPDGLKHRILRSTSSSDLTRAMAASLQMMGATGTGGCLDFREGGSEGVRALQNAQCSSDLDVIILGRDGGEGEADGLGISSTKEKKDFETAVATIKSEGKILALHAGEKDTGDIEDALAFEPDLLVHMTHADHHHLRQCADAGIPIAVCPRSNWVLGVTDGNARPPIRDMLNCGCEVLLGTDNVMFVQPDMLREMTFTGTIYQCTPSELLSMATAGSALFAQPYFLEVGNPARFFTVDPLRENLHYSRDILKSVCYRLFCI